MNILGICGSLRKDSYNRKLLLAAAAMLPAGTSFELAEIGTLPLYNQDHEGEGLYPLEAKTLKDNIRAAEGIIIATPEYNRSIPGVLKNAIDWTSRPYGDSAWEGKKVLVMGVSSGNISTALAQYNLKQVLLYLNTQIHGQPEVMIANAKERFAADGTLGDEKTKEFLQKAVTSFAQFATAQ